MTEAANNTGSSSKHGSDVPPELSVNLPSTSQISTRTKHPNEVCLPIDFLLLTVKDCEFLACYQQLKNPFRCWFSGVGFVYFEDECADQEEKVKVGLMKCNEGSTGPGGSLITVKNAVTKLKPKGVISVGTCSSLKPEKTKLGDVVVSAKLTTYAYKIVTSTEEQSTGTRSNVSRHFLHLIRHAGDGWKAPLKKPEARNIKVHCDGEFLSGPEQVSAGWRRDELAKSYPLATAIEKEGEGIFTAAFDDQIEWLVVKGIADYADGTECENWTPFASVMAASVVGHILSNPVVFQGWRHYEGGSEEEPSSAKRMRLEGPSSTTFDLNHCQDQLHRHYNTMSQVKVTPWNPNDTVHISEVYTNLSWLREDKTPRRTVQESLEDYSKVFEGYKRFKNPKRILAYGRPGIGKTTFSQKLSVDWSNGEKEILKKFDLLLTINLRDVCNIQDFDEALKAADLLAADDFISIDSLHKYVRENQEKVLIVLDGYDEYSAEETSDIQKIWKGSLLRNCCVLMTTRLTEDGETRKSSDIQCEIRGFDCKEQVVEFASKFLSKPEQVRNLMQLLNKENIWDIAEIPLLLQMLCLILREKHKSLPKSRLELYKKFVETILYHMVVKQTGKCAKGNVLNLYKDDLTKIGKLALEALLLGDVSVRRKHLDTQRKGLSEAMIKAGLFQISKLSSADPDESIFFLHKSVQEFLAAWFIMHETDLKKGKADCLWSIDSLDKIFKVEEILKFMCQWSVDGAKAVFRLLRFRGDKEGLRAYDFSKTPSIEDLSEDHINFISLNVDCLLCCSASDRRDVFSVFLECVDHIVILDKKQVPIVAREHLFTSSFPNYVFFNYWFSKTIDDDIFSIMVDLETTVFSCLREIRALEEYTNDLFAGDFFLKKEGRKMFFYVTRIYGVEALPTELLTELASAPVSPPQKPDVDLSKKTRQQQYNSSDLLLTENVTDQTRKHCLSFVRKIKINNPTNERLVDVKNVLPFVTSPRNVNIVSKVAVYDDVQLVKSIVSNINFTANLHSLILEGIDLTAKSATDIARSLHQAPNLRKLVLSRNSLNSGVSDLATNLHHVAQLTELKLSGVYMGDKECEILATSLKYVKQLQVLDLSHNPLGHGIIELAKGLNCVSFLKELWLEDTQMGEEEVSELARALMYVPKLTCLALGSNRLGKGISDVIQKLGSISYLEHLFLYGIKMTQREAKDLCIIIPRGAIIQSDYHVTDPGSDEIRLCDDDEMLKGGGYWLENYVNCGREEKYKPIRFAHEDHQEDEDDEDDHEDDEDDEDEDEDDEDDHEDDEDDEDEDDDDEDDHENAEDVDDVDEDDHEDDEDGRENAEDVDDVDEDDHEDDETDHEDDGDDSEEEDGSIKNEYDLNDSFIDDDEEAVTSDDESKDYPTSSDDEDEDDSIPSADED